MSVALEIGLSSVKRYKCEHMTMTHVKTFFVLVWSLYFYEIGIQISLIQKKSNPMTQQTAKHILRLYKDLLRYGQQLKYTDQHYFINWIQREFRENKVLGSPEKILFSIQVNFPFNKMSK